MDSTTPFQFLSAIFPEPLGPGQLMVWSKIRRSGKTATDWCYDLHRAGEQIELYRRTREVFFGVALHDRQRALARARKRFKRAAPSKVRGSEESVTALPALWAEIDAAAGDRSPSALPPRGRLAILEAVPRPPSIVVWTGTAFQVYWLVAGDRGGKVWVLEDDKERRRAKRLLAKIQWALASAAEAEGWGPAIATRTDDDLAEVRLSGLTRVAGTFRHRGGRHWPVVVEHLPTADARRWAPRDFDGLADPPPRPGSPPTWAGLAPGAPASPPEPGAGADFRAVWDGCSWLRHCYEDQATLPEREWHAALSIVGRARAAAGSPGGGPPDGADGRSLAHGFSARHPGYAPDLTEQALSRALGREAATCGRIGRELGALEAHCSACRHRGRIESPIALGDKAGDDGEPAPREGDATGTRETTRGTPAPPPVESPIDVRPAAAVMGPPQVELVIRMPPGAPQPGAPQPASWAPLVRAAIVSLERSFAPESRPADGDDAARVDAARRGGRSLTVLPRLLHGLEELLESLGAEGATAGGDAAATARQIVEALAAPRNRDRFGLLRAALRMLVPGLEGEVPTAWRLGRTLGRYRGVARDGRAITSARRGPGGLTWSVRES